MLFDKVSDFVGEVFNGVRYINIGKAKCSLYGRRCSRGTDMRAALYGMALLNRMRQLVSQELLACAGAGLILIA